MTSPKMLILCLFHLLTLGYVSFSVNWMEQTHLLMFLFALQALFAGLAAKWSKKSWGKTDFVALFLVCALARLLLIPCLSSDDMNRYIWEGTIQNHGFNPYQVPPIDPSLNSFHEQGLNLPSHHELTAIYPPFALLTFRLVTLLSSSKTVFKVLFSMLDLGVIALLLLLLGLRNIKKGNIFYYAFNPVVLFGFSARGHLDVLMVFFLVAFIYCFEKGHWKSQWFFYTLGVASKFLILLLLPCFLHRRNYKSLWILPALLILLYLPYMDAGKNLFSTFWIFVSKMEYNGSIFALTQVLFQGNQILVLILLGLAGFLVCIWSVLISEDGILTGLIIATFFLLLAPTVHFWYLSLLAPFLCFYPKPALMVWCALSGLWFVVLPEIASGTFSHHYQYTLMQYLPVYILFFIQLRKIAWAQPVPPELKEGQTLGIVIPHYNDESNLKLLLEDLQSNTLVASEVLVVDAGSSKQLQELCTAYGTRLIKSQLGRGYQVSAGIEECSSDLVLILHADKRLDSDVLERIVRLMQDPEIIGGCIGSRFQSMKNGQWFITLLNVIRARLMGVPFGDQGQFFKRSLYLEYSWDLKMPLMEDVELSLLLWNSRGKVSYLGGGIHSSTRRWEQKNRLKNALEIVYFVFLYCWLRRFQGKVDTSKLYEKYYNRKLNAS